MQNALSSGFIFLIQTLFDLYLYTLVLRMILVFFRISFANPVAQFIWKVTTPVVGPVEKVVPRAGRLDMATLVIAMLLEMLKLAIVTSVIRSMPSLWFLIFAGVAELISLTISVFFWAVIVAIVMSWLSPGRSTLTDILYQITEPLLAPVRKLIPPIAGFDVSPIAVLIGLKLLQLVLVLFFYSIA